MAATRSLSRFLSHVIPAAVMLVMVLALTVAHGGGVVSGSTDAHVALPVSAHAVTHRQPVALMVPDRVDAPSSTVVAVNDSGTDHDAVASCMLAVAALVGLAALTRFARRTANYPSSPSWRRARGPIPRLIQRAGVGRPPRFGLCVLRT